ncbi:MAG: hypothetical protein ACE5LU_08730 [Anaerolineae bacterium]
MTRKRVLGLSTIFLVVLLLTVGGTTAAADPAGLTIGLEIGADGSWKVAELFGQELELDPEAFNSVAKVLGLGFELPTRLMDPAQVAMLTQADIEQLTLALEGNAARVWLNDLQSPNVKVHLQNLQGLLPEAFVQPYGFLMQVLRFVPGAVYVRFTPAEFVRPELAAMEVSPAKAEPVNIARLEATVNSAGRMLSVAGFTAEELALLNVALPGIDPGVAAMLARFGKVTVDVTPSEMVLLADEQPMVELTWDAAGREKLLGMAESLGGFALDRQMVAIAEPWLESTHVNVGLHIADTSRDSTPSFTVGGPITVALEDGGMVSVAGVSVPVAGLDTGMLRNTVRAFGIEQAQVCWRGDEVRLQVNGMPMPFVRASEGWMPKAIRLTGWQAHPMAAKLEQVLAGLDVPVALLVDPAATAPAGGCADYRVAEAPKPLMTFGVDAAWNPATAELALKNVGLPFAALGMMPMDIAAQLRLPTLVSAFVPRDLGRVKATVGGNGLSANVDGVDLNVYWDATLLENVAKLGDRLGFGFTIRQVAPLLSMAEITVDVESTAAIAVSAQ